jgi:hypothetical protein
VPGFAHQQRGGADMFVRAAPAIAWPKGGNAGKKGDTAVDNSWCAPLGACGLITACEDAGAMKCERDSFNTENFRESRCRLTWKFIPL